MKLADSTFIVTGGASGLGAATARRFHGAGARVVIVDLAAEAGETLAAELGPRSAFRRADIASEADAGACVELALSRYGTLQGLVNCAGIGTPGRVLTREGPQPLADFTRTVTVNLIGTFNMIRLAADAMAKGEPNVAGERGVIVNTASIAAYEGQIGQAAYSAAKAGIVGMTLPIAREFARVGIRVCTIAPGLFQTPMMDGLPPEVQESLGQSVPYPPRLGRPDEFAALAQHIVENEMLNGATIRLDGAIRMPPK